MLESGCRTHARVGHEPHQLHVQVTLQIYFRQTRHVSFPPFLSLFSLLTLSTFDSVLSAHRLSVPDFDAAVELHAEAARGGSAVSGGDSDVRCQMSAEAQTDTEASSNAQIIIHRPTSKGFRGRKHDPRWCWFACVSEEWFESKDGMQLAFCGVIITLITLITLINLITLITLIRGRRGRGLAGSAKFFDYNLGSGRCGAKE